MGRLSGGVDYRVGCPRCGAVSLLRGARSQRIQAELMIATVRSNSALLTDTYTSPLRTRRGAAKRKR